MDPPAECNAKFPSCDDVVQPSARAAIARRLVGRSVLIIRSTKAAGNNSLGVTLTS